MSIEFMHAVIAFIFISIWAMIGQFSLDHHD